jgi:nitrogen-specific signal transduction histidine kinase
VSTQEEGLNPAELRELAHEIRNVLVIISGSAQLSLMERIGNATVENNLKTIVQETRRINEMIEKLVSAAKMKSGDECGKGKD